jgi:hypothetical protein
MWSPAWLTSFPKPRIVPQLDANKARRAEARAKKGRRNEEVFMVVVGAFTDDPTYLLSARAPWGVTLPTGF